METNEQPSSSAIGRFFRGFFSGAASSAVMMGIFYTLLFATGVSTIPTLATLSVSSVLLSVPALLIASVGIYGGLKAAWSSDAEHSHVVIRSDTERNVTIGVADTQLSRAQAQTITPVQTPAPFPGIAIDAAPAQEAPAAQRWTDRPDIARNDRSTIASLLADGAKRSDRQLAEAILASREQASASASTSR